MTSYALHTRRPFRLLAVGSAALVCALAPSTASAAEAPVAPPTGIEGEIHSSSVVKLSPLLSVHSARVRRGRLAIASQARHGRR